MNSDLVEITSRWGVEVEGDADDLRNMESKINGSVQTLDSLFVARMDDLFVLRCRKWDAAPNPETAQELATIDLQLVRSCLDLLDGCGALSIGTVFCWDQEARQITQTRDTELTVRVKKDEKAWSTPEQFRQLFDGAEKHVHLKDALREHAWSANWYEVYKALEALKHFYGDKHRLLKAFPEEKTQIERLKRTANAHRHTRRAFAEYKDPMPLSDARRLLAKLLKGAAEGKAVSTRSANALPLGTQLNLKHYYKPDGGKYGLKKLDLDPVAGPNGFQWDLGDPRRTGDD
jgi:hypothetical protein